MVPLLMTAFPQSTTVQYATISDAICMIKMAGKGCFLAKTDIENAFHLIPICPDDYNFQDIKWKGVYYYDCCMPMDCPALVRHLKHLAQLFSGLPKTDCLLT